MEAHDLARDAVRHAIANQDVSATIDLLAEEAGTAPSANLRRSPHSKQAIGASIFHTTGYPDT